jgi:hypothetical protein
MGNCIFGRKGTPLLEEEEEFDDSSLNDSFNNTLKDIDGRTTPDTKFIFDEGRPDDYQELLIHQMLCERYEELGFAVFTSTKNWENSGFTKKSVVITSNIKIYFVYFV